MVGRAFSATCVSVLAWCALAGCGGTTTVAPAPTVTVTASESASPSPTPSASYVPEYTCDAAVKEAKKTSRINNKGTDRPLLVAIVDVRGPVVDRSDDPPRNGDVFICQGAGVFSTGETLPIRFGWTMKSGQWLVFFEPR